MPKQMESAFKRLILEIAPSENEIKEEKAFANSLIKRIKSHLPKNSRALLAGSVAKGTFLKDSKDVDIFLLFSKSVEKEKFEGIVKKIAAKTFPTEKKETHYAEHPYVRIKFGNRKMDLVPAYDIKTAEEKASAVDRSVLHTKYILRKLQNSKRADVLLLKKLFKANGLYGAEIRVEGFSGYLCELLIIKYGSFINAMRAMVKWRIPVVIDIEKHYPTATLPMEKFRLSPLIVIDPVDKQRNVSAIVSEANIKRAKTIAKKIISGNIGVFSGSEKEFKEKELKKMMKTGTIYALSFPKPDIVDDILWGQMKRFSKNIVTGLEHLEFKVKNILLREENKTCELYFGLKEDELGPKMLLKGPPIRNDLKKNVVTFKKAHKKARFVKKSGHIFAIVKRRIITANDAFKLILSKEQNVPSHISVANIKIKKIEKN